MTSQHIVFCSKFYSAISKCCFDSLFYTKLKITVLARGISIRFLDSIHWSIRVWNLLYLNLSLTSWLSKQPIICIWWGIHMHKTCMRWMHENLLKQTNQFQGCRSSLALSPVWHSSLFIHSTQILSVHSTQLEKPKRWYHWHHAKKCKRPKVTSQAGSLMSHFLFSYAEKYFTRDKI